ncbi:MAG: response regulator, partial [Gammaproteobacteria bacterium]|nr:response regulator [Gammaproteobacteria bacterium]
MASKRALVVDDSKSARVVLSRMLEKYGIVVDAADCAEAALEYLQAARPDVIFMDHLMPGMDGLQAVREIKANPATAAIPIMMYTSQEGDLYAGLARASGAVGVLPKSIHPIDVTKALYQLQLLPDRRDREPPVLQPVDGEGHATEAAPLTAATPAPDPRLRGLIEQLLREQSVELRRFVVATLDSYAHRILTELRPREPAEPAAEQPAAPEQTSAGSGPRWVGAIAALAALAVAGLLYWQVRAASERTE